MSIYQNDLLNDHFLLWQCGLVIPETSKPDRAKIANFFGVAESLAARWILRGIPRYARRQLIMIMDGRMLPPRWRGIQITHDGLVLLASGQHVPIENLRLLPLVLRHVDWSKVPALALAPKQKSGFSELMSVLVN